MGRQLESERKLPAAMFLDPRRHSWLSLAGAAVAAAARSAPILLAHRFSASPVEMPLALTGRGDQSTTQL
jgi:hypothetical protein